MYLRSGTQTTEIIAAPFESTTIPTSSPEEILQEMVNNINRTNSQQEKIPMLIDLYRYLYQRAQYFKKPEHKILVSAIIKKSSEFKLEIIDIIENRPDTSDEISNNAYRLYYYIDVVMSDFRSDKR